MKRGESPVGYCHSQWRKSKRKGAFPVSLSLNGHEIRQLNSDLPRSCPFFAQIQVRSEVAEKHRETWSPNH